MARSHRVGRAPRHTVNELFSVANFLYCQIKLVPDQAPWKGTEILNFALLFLTADVGLTSYWWQLLVMSHGGWC